MDVVGIGCHLGKAWRSRGGGACDGLWWDGAWGWGSHIISCRVDSGSKGDDAVRREGLDLYYVLVGQWRGYVDHVALIFRGCSVHSMGRCDVLPGEMGNSNPLDPWVVNEKVGKWT